MAEDIIKGKIIFDAAGGLTGGGSVSGGGKKGASSSVFTGILGKLGAIAGSTALLAKASPQLGATLGVMFKAILLILRPIGDVISMFLRPLAIGLIRFLIPILKKWNAFKKTELGEKVAPVVGGAATGAMIGGAIGGIPGAAIGAGIGAVAGLMVAFWDDFKQGLQNISYAWTTFISDPFKQGIENIGYAWTTFISDPFKQGIENIGFAWETVSGLFLQGLENISHAWSVVATFVSEKVIAPIRRAWLAVWNFISEKLIEPVKEAFLGVYNYINDNVVQPVKDAWETIVTWFTTNIIDPIKSAFKTLVNFFIDLANAVLPGSPIPNLQTGGYIGQTGLYNLHQGETVIPAHMQGMTNNFTPNITINANVSNDMDLQALADQLSGIMMDNLSRRNSYTFT